jgi:type I restriction enzyme S subunit
LNRELKTSIHGDVQRASRIHQSMLSWAFSRRLVDRDPIKEPASALLDRIKAERAAAGKPPHVRRAGRNREAPA